MLRPLGERVRRWFPWAGRFPQSRRSVRIQASAAVALAFSRTYLLKMLSPRDGYVHGMKISIQHLGLTWFAVYASILTFIFHFWMFFFEKFRFGDIFYTLGKILISTIVALVLIILIQYLVIKPSKRNV